MTQRDKAVYQGRPAIHDRLPDNPLCERKIWYASRTVARDAAIAASKRYGVKLRHYRCRHCRKWHVGRPTEIDDARRAGHAVTV